MFVNASEIPFTLLETPYYLEPLPKSEKVYALLREAMASAGVIAVARIVLHTKERLAALIPDGNTLVLNTIRWANEIRPKQGLKLPAAGRSAALKPGELKMAGQLIASMTGPWKSDHFEDKFTAAIHALAAQRARAGKTAEVTPREEMPEAPARSNVVDLTALLKQSLSKSAGRKKSRSRKATKSKAGAGASRRQAA